jgi:Bacteriophage tail sheath protein
MEKAGQQRRQLRKREAEWKWRKNYRVWEANRKIFLYPENWIEPELQLSTRLRAALDDVVAFICARCGAKTKRKPIGKPAHRKGVRGLLTGRNRMGALVAAQTLARDLGKDLYRVDLGAVVSKYIGETEKNLRRAFDAARKSRAVLFFDEAEALFGKRTDVKDSPDRYANIEINYLLKRIEEYVGLAIFASGNRTKIDNAFSRRFHFVVSIRARRNARPKMTLDLKYPGIFVQEVPTGVRTITGVSTSVTAFVGAASCGRRYRAVRINSFAEFEQRFGGLSANLDLGYAVQQFSLNGGKDAWVVRVARPLSAAKIIKGIHALDPVDIFNLLVIPGVMSSEALFAAADYCQERRAFLIMDSAKSVQTPAQMEQAVRNTMLPKTSYCAIYFPWINIPDPLSSGQLRLTPPSGSVAGLFARVDGSRGVWKSPAGTGADLVGVSGLSYNLTDSENGALKALGVNCLRVFPTGTLVWGARTLEGADQSASEWKYIAVRRLTLFIEESIDRGIQWAVFEPNAEPLWAQIRLNVGAFLQQLFGAGAFQGRTPRDAYFVKCDAATTTQNDIDAGVVNVVIGFAPLKPAEFIILKFSTRARPPC